MQKLIILFGCLVMVLTSTAQPEVKKQKSIVPGAERMENYLPLLQNKAVAVFANPTSMVRSTHLVDTLLRKGILVRKIFSPEHGFRGAADAGEQVRNEVDAATGLPVISLYGDHRKPTAGELADVEVLVFDIQDVGVRFYTYISSLQYLLEAAIEYDKPLLLLDRPNPNGFYVDGPVLQKGFNSFVGMQPVPVVYGMTEGEYAGMLLGENWLNAPAKAMVEPHKTLPAASLKTPGSPAGLPSHFSLRVIPCQNYDHTMTYDLPVKPSPNLPNLQSILLYPSLCFFEGTEVSLGRGTDKPFQVFGHPAFPDTLYRFKPASVPGAKSPPQLGNTCFGFNLSQPQIDITRKANREIPLSYLLDAYNLFPQKDNFFLRPKKGNPAGADYFFNKLAGNEELMWQILNNQPEAAIRKSWLPGITAFKKIRKKYLLYRDFE